MRSHRQVFSALAALVLPAVALCACAPATAPDVRADGGASSADAWVVVVYEGRDAEFDGSLMDALLETELAADQALAESGAGWIDGNDVGAHGYELYFIGSDTAEMWRVLEPVFATAPVRWTRVEMRDGLEDPSPTTLTQD